MGKKAKRGAGVPSAPAEGTGQPTVSTAGEEPVGGAVPPENMLTPDSELILEGIPASMQEYMLPAGPPSPPPTARRPDARAHRPPTSNDHKNLVAGHEWATTFFAGSFGAVTLAIAAIFVVVASRATTPAASAAAACIAGTSLCCGLRVFYGSQSCRFLRHRPTSQCDSVAKSHRQNGKWYRVLAILCAVHPLCYYGALAVDDVSMESPTVALYQQAYAEFEGLTWEGASEGARALTAAVRATAAQTRVHHMLLVLPVMIFVASEAALYFLRMGYLEIKAARQRSREAGRRKGVEGSLKRKILAHMERSRDGEDAAADGGGGRDPLPVDDEALAHLLRKEQRNRTYIMKEQYLTLFYKTVRANMHMKKLEKECQTRAHAADAQSLPTRAVLFFPNLLADVGRTLFLPPQQRPRSTAERGVQTTVPADEREHARTNGGDAPGPRKGKPNGRAANGVPANGAGS